MPDNNSGMAGQIDQPDLAFAHELEAIAQGIEQLERNAILRIAEHVAMAHQLFVDRRDEGGFKGWAENRLGYSRSHAYRLLDVACFARVSQAWDTLGTLPVSAIYQLAAPSTPKAVHDEIAERVKAGEKVTVAEVTEAIAMTKGKPCTKHRMSATARRTVIEILEQASEEEVQFLREQVLYDFFSSATGADIMRQIPENRREVVSSGILDSITVEGMCSLMSKEFGAALRARMPAPKRKADKPKSAKAKSPIKGMNLVRSGVDKSGNPIFVRKSSFRQ